MGNITISRHLSLLNKLADSIRWFERMAGNEQKPDQLMVQLKKNQAKLDKVFTQCDKKTSELRQLIREYQQAEINARLALRNYNKKFQHKPSDNQQ